MKCFKPPVEFECPMRRIFEVSHIKSIGKEKSIGNEDEFKTV